jgi:hypothetical protein
LKDCGAIGFVPSTYEKQAVQRCENIRNSLGLELQKFARNPDTTATCSYQLKPHGSRNPAALIGHIAGRARSIDNDVINHA